MLKNVKLTILDYQNKHKIYPYDYASECAIPLGISEVPQLTCT